MHAGLRQHKTGLLTHMSRRACALRPGVIQQPVSFGNMADIHPCSHCRDSCDSTIRGSSRLVDILHDLIDGRKAATSSLSQLTLHGLSDPACCIREMQVTASSSHRRQSQLHDAQKHTFASLSR